ncbi:substrate-binding domain-containing protein [Bradyrhizobium sp. BRP22]|uniref:molybdate ABC transporter substrate-binding protein n=1 Tax=Bradyrhizobium sp. BRP22 TaxID=2793821 RepID=UPI001CD40763|nr:substrate-binding domain-containing protein [Bradyrhizobium sp. BRP22]MCA1453585.1 substrate-binding domain-containing protein [Bradyrhizobium sp. BRP22]
MNKLHVLSGGAAQGLVKTLAPTFTAATGLRIDGEFGAVGVMAEKLRNGAAADTIILTSALVATLAAEKLVSSTSIRDIGLVETALAVRAGDPPVAARDAASLREALRAADAIFVPDTKASTAGIHVAKVLRQLGIAREVEQRLRIFPNGATAMRHLAESEARRPIGCTQSTEIIATNGVALSGALPPGCALATQYTAAITTRTSAAPAAERLIDLLTATETEEARSRAGFVPSRSV